MSLNKLSKRKTINGVLTGVSILLTPVLFIYDCIDMWFRYYYPEFYVSKKNKKP